MEFDERRENISKEDLPVFTEIDLDLYKEILDFIFFPMGSCDFIYQEPDIKPNPSLPQQSLTDKNCTLDPRRAHLFDDSRNEGR